MAKKSKKSQKDTVVDRAPKEEKLFQNLRKSIIQFMEGKGFNPMSEHDLFQRLGFASQHIAVFQEIIVELLNGGLLQLSKGQYNLKKNHSDVLTGILRVHPRGFGFLQADDTTLYEQDIFIPKHLTQNAVDGDHVEVQVNTAVISDKGPEGRVVTILERGRSHLAGIIRQIESYGEILAFVPLLGSSQRVVVQDCPEKPLTVGDRVVMEVIDWGTKDTETLCKVSHHLGHITDPSCDIKAAIKEYEIRSEFSAKVQKETKMLGNKVSRKDIADREDFREVECFTVDPDTAKDFDDAITLTLDEEGHYHLGVHIADVSHYVRPGTAIDKEAALRCNSTYFPGCCVPMLPPELSENLCSLKEKVARLTVSVIMEFDLEGNLVTYRISRSVIKSAKRFSYRQAKEILDGKKKSKHLPTLKLMVELCGLLKKKRYERGSIEFALPDLVVIVDDKGVPQKTDYVSYDITHQMIEEFMLKANEMVAWHLAQQGKNLTYRVHDVPSEDNMKDFALLAAAFGFRLSDNPAPQELQNFFDESMQTSYGQYLATSYIRRNRLAIYSPENIGHYGLGLTHYCHFTSPIRRYVDLVAHRILFGESDDLTSLELVAAKCSEQERISARAESNVVLLKKLRLLQSVQEKDRYKEYEAVITKVKGFGFYFEVLDMMLEGFVHISDVGEDYYVFEESLMRLKGRRTGETYCTGDRIHVMLKSVDFILLDSKWYLVGKKESIQQPVNNKAKSGYGKERTGKGKERTGYGKDKGKPSRSAKKEDNFPKNDKPVKPVKSSKPERSSKPIASKPKKTDRLEVNSKILPSSGRKPFPPARQVPKSKKTR